MVKPTTARPTTAEPITIKQKPPLKLRHEWKHMVNPADDFLLANRLQKLFRHDENADSHGVYRVSSLYFDTPYDKALRQKLDGVNLREKFRLRYYGDDLSFIRLEKKFKINGLCGKHSVRVPEDQVRRILEGSFDCLLESENPLLLEFYSKLKGQQLMPKTVVTYDREAFLYDPGNVRITLDRNLRTAMGPGSFLDPGMYHWDMSDGMTVLEVKYDEFLPEIVRLAVQTPNRQASAYSKYALCRRFE